jgi:hypothetical protein
MSSTARMSPARHPPVTLEALLALGPSLLRRISGAHVVWALLVAATLPWRAGVYYDGGADSVVIAKAALSLLALAIAVHLVGGARRIVGVPAYPVLIVITYLFVTIIGGYGHGTLLPAAVVGVRMAIVCVTITLLFAHYKPLHIARALVHVLAVLVTAGVLSGLPSAARGRLAGAVPPLHPNELAFLASVCFFWVFARMLQAKESTQDILVAVACAGVVVLTGSRAGLAALCVAIVVMTFRASRLTRRSFGLVALMGPVLVYVAFGTDLLSSVFLRGGERGVSTLSNRTISWDAALNSDHDPWETWFGAGLAQKKIEVPGQWWTTQLLDSSWVSALVQGGLLGIVLVILMVLATLWRAMTSQDEAGALWLGLAVFLFGRAFLESGLFDSSTSFIVFMVAAIGCRMPPPRTPPSPAAITTEWPSIKGGS